MEALQGLIFKFREDRKIFHTSVETFVDCLSNKDAPWASYCVFMSIRLISIDKHPGVRPVRVGENWKNLFSNCVLRVTGPESTSACQDY